MGCGQSSVGSDSPKRNRKKKEIEAEESSTDDEGKSAVESEDSHSRNPQTHNSILSFGTGGQLLAQAKISDSQIDFFKMLDEKIESGADYDSEEEDVRHVRELEARWTMFTNQRPQSFSASEGRPVLRSVESPQACNFTEQEEDEWSEPEYGPEEAIREQYMFMGNVYTLTRLRSDGNCSHPQVNIITTPAANGLQEKQPRQGTPTKVLHKVNGAPYKGNTMAFAESMITNQDETLVVEQSSQEHQGTCHPSSLALRTLHHTDDMLKKFSPDM